jgi:hypothetical protein
MYLGGLLEGFYRSTFSRIVNEILSRLFTSKLRQSFLDDIECTYCLHPNGEAVFIFSEEIVSVTHCRISNGQLFQSGRQTVTDLNNIAVAKS